jgi:hypothetical protein
MGTFPNSDGCATKLSRWPGACGRGTTCASYSAPAGFSMTRTPLGGVKVKVPLGAAPVLVERTVMLRVTPLGSVTSIFRTRSSASSIQTVALLNQDALRALAFGTIVTACVARSPTRALPASLTANRASDADTMVPSGSRNGADDASTVLLTTWPGALLGTYSQSDFPSDTMRSPDGSVKLIDNRFGRLRQSSPREVSVWPVKLFVRRCSNRTRSVLLVRAAVAAAESRCTAVCAVLARGSMVPATTATADTRASIGHERRVMKRIPTGMPTTYPPMRRPFLRPSWREVCGQSHSTRHGAVG